MSVKTLLQGRVLGIEDMVDVLTLKDGFEEYSTAMELLKNDRVCLLRVVHCSFRAYPTLEGNTRSSSTICDPDYLAKDLHLRRVCWSTYLD